MVFSSMVFLWIFLPVVFVLSRIIRNLKAQNILLLLASLVFYAWGEPSYLILLLVSIFMNWIFGLLIDRFRNRGKLFLALDVIANLALLGYFKYADFSINTVNRLFHTSIPAANIALPVGISFFTFQAMSYVIDLYRGEYKVQKNLLDLALYVSFFPQLIAGPIVLYKDIDEQIRHREITREKTASGIRRFLYGLGKKVILSNLIAIAVDNLFGLDVSTMSGAQAWIAAIGYTLQIYYDFSGYSDMAIGVSKLFGYALLPNFDSPYQAVSVTDFWRRWHISLTSFLREYVYFPLGGSRKGTARTYLNILIVFLVSGIWHGANWTFVLWGVLHGLCQMAERAGKPVLQKIPVVIRRIVTFLVVSYLWLLFRSADLAEFKRVCWHLFIDRHFTINGDFLSVFRLPGIRNLMKVLHLGLSDYAVSALSAGIYVGVAIVLCNAFPNTNRRTYRFGRGTLVILAVLFYICLLSLTGVSTFVYNNF